VGETSQPTATPQAAAPPTEVEVNPGTLTIMIGDLGNERFDRVLSVGNGVNYARIMGGYLISTNEKREMVPGIAEEWNLSEDGLTWNFTIREGVKFHDGSDATAEDVQWTFQHSFGPQAANYAIHSDAAQISRMIQSIELRDSDTVSLTTAEPVIAFADLVSEAGIFWYHVLPQRSTPHNEEEELAYDREPIGAGPMRLTNHIKASEMNFERFADFYYQPANGFPEDKRMKFQMLDLFLVPEESTRVAALQAGDADIVPVSVATQEQAEASGGRIVFGPEGVHVAVDLGGCWETQHPCHDMRVRQALNYAINKELMRDQLYGGPEVFEVKGWHSITPNTIGYTSDLDPFPFDPEKARQLLANAGYPGGEGFGKLIVNTYPAPSMPFLTESAQLASEFWRRELGLDVEVRVSDNTAVSERERAGELYGQVIWGQNETRRDATGLISDSYGNRERLDRAHNDEELFRLTQQTVTILDPDARTAALEDLYVRLRDESYQLGIGFVNIPWGVAPRVQTWEPYPMALWPSELHTITLN
jgi:peptide/nickel transport system substrate-binding protein